MVRSFKQVWPTHCSNLPFTRVRQSEDSVLNETAALKGEGKSKNLEHKRSPLNFANYFRVASHLLLWFVLLIFFFLPETFKPSARVKVTLKITDYTLSWSVVNVPEARDFLPPP